MTLAHAATLYLTFVHRGEQPSRSDLLALLGAN